MLRTWGAPFEAQGKAVVRPYTNVAERESVSSERLWQAFGERPAIWETIAATGGRRCGMGEAGSKSAPSHTRGCGTQEREPNLCLKREGLNRISAGAIGIWRGI